MKEYLISVCCLLIVVLLIFFGQAFSQDSQESPDLELKEREFYFGEVEEGENISHSFTVKNTGTAPLEITSVSPG